MTSATNQPVAAPGAAGHAADGMVTSADPPSVALFDPLVRTPFKPKPELKCVYIPRYKTTVCPATNPLALKVPIIRRISPPAIHPPVA